MAKINSNQKGKEGEREFAKICRQQGFEKARRSQQYAGINNDADVVGLPGIHAEIKRVERLNVDKALEQSINDSKDEDIPIVAHRKNRQEWKVTMRLNDWFKLYKSWLNEEVE